MFAIVRGAGLNDISPLTDIAGRPLIERQLDWLCASGVERVVVEIGPDHEPERVLALLQESTLGRRAFLVPTGRLLRCGELAARVGLDPDAPQIWLRSNVLGDVDLVRALGKTRAAGCSHAYFPAPSSLVSTRGGSIAFSAERRRDALLAGEGWVATLVDADDARALSRAILEKTLPTSRERWSPAVHGFEQQPSVFVARGASIDPTATLRDPVFVGRNAKISAGAVVGPNVVLGDNAAVERGAFVRDCQVEAYAIVGERTTLVGAEVTSDGRVAFRGDEAPVALDPLLLGTLRDGGATGQRAGIARGLLAVPMVALLATVWLVARLLRRPSGARWARLAFGRFHEWYGGERRLVGVEGEGIAPHLAGLIDVSVALQGCVDAPALAQQATARWYERAKSPRLDARLAWTELGRHWRGGRRLPEGSPAAASPSTALPAPRSMHLPSSRSRRAS